MRQVCPSTPSGVSSGPHRSTVRSAEPADPVKAEPPPPPGPPTFPRPLGRSISDRSPGQELPYEDPFESVPEYSFEGPFEPVPEGPSESPPRLDFASADFALRGTGRGPPMGSAEAASGSTMAETTTPAITIMRRSMAAPPVDWAGIPDDAPKISTKSGRRGGAHPFNAELDRLTPERVSRAARTPAREPHRSPPTPTGSSQYASRLPPSGALLLASTRASRTASTPGSQGVTGPGSGARSQRTCPVPTSDGGRTR